MYQISSNYYYVKSHQNKFKEHETQVTRSTRHPNIKSVLNLYKPVIRRGRSPTELLPYCLTRENLPTEGGMDGKEN